MLLKLARVRSISALQFAVGGFALLVVGLIWLVAMAELMRERADTLADAAKDGANLTRVLDEHVLRTLSQVDQLALLVKARYEAAGGRFDLKQFFEQAHVSRELVHNAMISNEADIVVAGTAPPLEPIYLGDREHVAVHHARDSGQLFIGKPVLERVAKRWDMIVTRRINKPDGSFGGVVGVNLNPFYFIHFYQQVEFGRDRVVALVGLDGVVRAHLSDRSAETGQDIRADELFRQLARKPQGGFSTTSPVDGVRRIYSYRKLASYPVVVLVGIAEEEALADFEQRKLYDVGAAAATTLIVLLAAAGLVTLARRQQHTAGELREQARLFGLTERLAGTVTLEWEIGADKLTWSRPQEFLLGPRPPGGYPLYREMVHPQDRERWLAHRQRALESGEATFNGHRIVRTDGEVRWLETHEQAEPADDGRARRMVITIADVTARKQAELGLQAFTGSLERAVAERTAEIRERRNRQRTVIDLVPHLIFAKDRDGRYLMVNRAYADMYKSSIKDIIGKTGLEVGMSPESVAQGDEADQRIRATGETVEIRDQLIRIADGPERVFWTIRIPFRYSDQHPDAVLGVSMEITDLKAAQDGLRRTLSLLEATLDATADGILVVATDGRISDFNRHFVSMWRIPEDIVESHDERHMTEFMLDQLFDPTGFVAKVDERQAQAGAESFDVLLLKDGRVFERHSRPQRVDGKAVGRVWSFSDVSERTRAELGLRDSEARLRQLNANLEERVAERTAELTAANQELEAFSTSVSHDLRAPLRAVVGFSRLLLDEQRENPDDHRQQLLERIAAAGQRMGEMIDGMLGLAHLNRSRLKSLPLDLSALARLVWEEVVSAEPGRIVRFRLSEGLTAACDPVLIRSLLQNLFANAFKFTRESREAQVEFDSVEHNGETVFVVRDNGAGFDMAYVKKLFGMFQRLHTSKEFEGMGIGLAISQRIVQRHGGRIWAEGKPNEGAAFFFTLAQRHG